MTMEDLKTRWIANRRIADPVAREADLDTLKADVATEWGADRIDYAFAEATAQLSPRL